MFIRMKTQRILMIERRATVLSIEEVAEFNRKLAWSQSK